MVKEILPSGSFFKKFQASVRDIFVVTVLLIARSSSPGWRRPSRSAAPPGCHTVKRESRNMFGNRKAPSYLAFSRIGPAAKCESHESILTAEDTVDCQGFVAKRRVLSSLESEAEADLVLF